MLNETMALSEYLERTLCLLKPDGVRRGLLGTVLHRFEQAGFKIVALKLVHADKDLAGQHYSYEDIAVRHGEAVRNNLIQFITSGPVAAFVLEGVGAVECVRKICGATEPHKSVPGTIRGDFSHHNYALAAARGQSVRNVIHASADLKDAQREIPLWFSPQEILEYRTNDQEEHFLG